MHQDTRRVPGAMKISRAPLTALLAAVALVAVACGGTADPTADDAGAAESSGDATAADVLSFDTQLVAGGDFRGTSVEGSDTVFWFWAPWCTICRAEAPDVMAAAEAFDGQVQVVGVAGRGELEEMQGFVADTGTGGLDHVVDHDGSIWSSFGVSAQPAFAFVDDDGTVEVFVGSLGETGLTERMQALAEA
jgi:thiol-disulfide isomerase/thioredoxin